MLLMLSNFVLLSHLGTSIVLYPNQRRRKLLIATNKENNRELRIIKSGCGRHCLPVTTINRDNFSFLYRSKCASGGVAKHGGFFPARTVTHRTVSQYTAMKNDV